MKFQTALLASSVCLAMIPASVYPRLSSAKKTECFKVNSCKCIMNDGTGVINLKTPGHTEGFLAYLKPVLTGSPEPNAEILLSFSPCQPFSEPEDLARADCDHVAACVVVRFHRLNRYMSRYISYGVHEGNQFHYNASTKTLSVSYFAQAYSHQPLTVVHYHCNPNQSSTFIHTQSLSADKLLNIWVESPCACTNACALGDLGLGTIFLIILSISAMAYLVLGSCALRPFRTSSGVQLAPERSVWCMPCYLLTERGAERGKKRHGSLREYQTL